MIATTQNSFPVVKRPGGVEATVEGREGGALVQHLHALTGDGKPIRHHHTVEVVAYEHHGVFYRIRFHASHPSDSQA